MQDMPPRARNYVIAVITVGAALFGGCLPSVRFDEPMLFIGLLLISALSASLKVKLPYTTTGSAPTKRCSSPWPASSANGR